MAPRPPMQITIETAAYDETRRSWRQSLFQPDGTPIDLSAVGGEGPVGPAGPIGPKGDKGDPGDLGAPGATGNQGPQGPQGPKGDPGDPGPTGSQGPTGATGSQGPKGDKGDQGDPGPAGTSAPVADVHDVTGVTSVDLTGLVHDPSGVYEILVDGLVATAADRAITLRPTGGDFTADAFLERVYADGGGTFANNASATNQGLYIGVTGWNSDCDVLIEALVTLRDDRNARSTSQFTTVPHVATSGRAMRGSAAARLKVMQTITSLTVDFGGGTFTGRVQVKKRS